MKRRFLVFGLPLLPILAGCAPTKPQLAQVEATLPGIPSGMARFYFYRDPSVYESTAIRAIYLNKQEIGLSYPNGVIYRDVAPGQYEVSVYTEEAYPNQFKNVLVRPGEVRYAKIQFVQGWGEATSFDPIPRETWVVTLIDPAQGGRETRPLWYYGGGVWTPK